MNTQQPSRVGDLSSKPIAPNINTLWARIIVDECARAGLKHVVISPGSRSAPLVFQFVAHPDINDYSVVDERSAAFFALGIARESGKPVALVCTTGTAAANYFPAICEAERDQIPLLVLTSARPPEDHDSGVQQVMDQHHLYGSHVRAFHALAQPEVNAEKLAALRSTVARAWARSKAPEPGPVHLDIPFRKPLEPVQTEPNHADHVPTDLAPETQYVVAGRADGSPWVLVNEPVRAPTERGASELIELLNSAERPLVIAGADPRGSRYASALDALADQLQIPVLAEPVSGLRHRRERSASVLGAGELLAAGAFYDRFGRPDVVVHCGRAPLNWSLQRLLRESMNASRVAVTETAALADPDHRIERQWIADPKALFEQACSLVTGRKSKNSNWLTAHQMAEKAVLEQITIKLADDQLITAPGLWARLKTHLPENAALICSSSMIVRDLDSYLAGARQSLRLFFNRGLNGIDGVVATATGVAARRSLPLEPTVLVIGDVALRHDLGSVMLADELGLSLTIVIVDNNGGEIFDYLPTAGFGEIHERHFVTPRKRPLTDLLPRGLAVDEPTTLEQFDTCFKSAVNAPGLSIIRCGTDRSRDQELRKALIAAARTAIEGVPALDRLITR